MADKWCTKCEEEKPHKDLHGHVVPKEEHTMESAKRSRPGNAPSPKKGSQPHGNAAPFNPAPVKQDKGESGDYKHEKAVAGNCIDTNSIGTGRKC